MSSSEWLLYLRTIVDIEVSRATTVRILPEPPGSQAPWYEALPSPLHVLTAWNPGEMRLPIDVNRSRQFELEAELPEWIDVRWRAIGRDPASDYFEEGIAIHGATEQDVIGLARRYDQQAIYSLTPTEWATVSCNDERRIALGWRIEVTTKGQFESPRDTTHDDPETGDGRE